MDKKIYCRVIVPAYIKAHEFSSRQSEYTPWVIGHTNADALTNEALDAMGAKFTQEIYPVTEGDFSDFVTFLEEEGYIAYYVDTPGVWSPQ